MTAANLFRCACGYEVQEKPRPGHELVAVYHIHSGPTGWGPQSVRMEPVLEIRPIKAPAPREVAAVS